MSISQAEKHLRKSMSVEVKRQKEKVGMYWLLASIAESLISVAKAQEERNVLLEEINALSAKSEKRLAKLAEIQFDLYRQVQGDERATESQV